MRKEVPISKVTGYEEKCSPALEQLYCKIDGCPPRAKHAASSLYTVNSICCSLFGSKRLQFELTEKLMAIVGALSLLQPLLFVGLEEPLLSPADVDALFRSMVSCEPIFEKISTAQRVLDEHLNPGALREGMWPAPKTDPEVTERERLLRTLPAPMRHSESIGARNVPLRTNAGAALEPPIQNYHHAQQPAHQLQKPASERLPSSSTGLEQRSCWGYRPALPTSKFSEYFPDLPRANRQTTPSTSDRRTPTSFKESSPILDRRLGSIVTKSALPPPAMSSRNEPNPVWSFLPQPTTNNTAIKMTTASSRKVTSGAPRCLKAIILQPRVESQRGSVSCWYRIEPLPLSEQVMHTHIEKLGSNYSTVNAVAKLTLLQLNVLQDYLEDRQPQGQLVAVQYGKELELLTAMGTFKVKSVVFVIEMEEEPDKAQDNVRRAAAFVPGEQPTGPFGQFGVASGNGFGSAKPFELARFAPASAFKPSPPTCKPPPAELTPGQAKEAELGFHEEKDTPFEPKKRYMSITSRQDRSNESFEEHRLTDYTKAASIARNACGLPPPASTISTTIVANTNRASTQQRSADSSCGGSIEEKPNTTSTGIFGTAPVPRFGHELFDPRAPSAEIFDANTFRPPRPASSDPICPAASTGLFGAAIAPLAKGQPAEVTQPASFFGDHDRFGRFKQGLSAQPQPAPTATSNLSCGNYNATSGPVPGKLDSPSPPNNPFAFLRAPEVSAASSTGLFSSLTTTPPPPTNLFSKLSMNNHQHAPPFSSVPADEDGFLDDNTCWLCEGTVKKDVNVAPAPTSIVAPTWLKDTVQTSEESNKTGDESSPTLTTTKASDQLAVERKERIKAVEFDSNDESEEVWSARYDRLEARRLEDEKKKANAKLETTFVAQANGTAWSGTHVLDPPKSDTPPFPQLEGEGRQW
ncbi:hypothetical protein EK21DRAFT_83858 [Setomelanomma holmii]|uniref:Uncharacterized protein n=1 Tax=Setomelanomma holmii TaxID=210430 RepID=A0A9P4HKQ4_9PLEO|nr:hypothetical protein EK21DRAFT_83858 [Setomelanomma holmii]